HKSPSSQLQKSPSSSSSSPQISLCSTPKITLFLGDTIFSTQWFQSVESLVSLHCSMHHLSHENLSLLNSSSQPSGLNPSKTSLELYLTHPISVDNIVCNMESSGEYTISSLRIGDEAILG
ncbi:hypothetical protein F2P56_013877, partial [Juglans regia]